MCGCLCGEKGNGERPLASSAGASLAAQMSFATGVQYCKVDARVKYCRWAVSLSIAIRTWVWTLTQSPRYAMTLVCVATLQHVLTLTVSKTWKLARVRENQRRCRSRKQEYVSDLEKRVTDCHISCSRADLEKEWRQRLEVENSKLRDLLHLVGVEKSLVDAYVNETTPTAGATQSLRPIQPKLDAGDGRRGSSSIVTQQNADVLQQTFPAQTHTDFVPYTASGPLMAPAHKGDSPVNVRSDDTSATLSATYDPATKATLHGISGLTSPSLSKTEPLCCGPNSNTALQSTAPPTATDTTLCSIAMSLIEQYNTTNSAVQEISDRLAPGFTSEARPGEGCRVQNQLLFHVLNDISSGLS